MPKGSFMEDERLACPLCGSKILCWKGNIDSVYFEIDPKLHVNVLKGTEEISIHNSTSIQCGACSWKGVVHQLTLSLM